MLIVLMFGVTILSHCRPFKEALPQNTQVHLSPKGLLLSSLLCRVLQVYTSSSLVTAQLTRSLHTNVLMLSGAMMSMNCL